MIFLKPNNFLQFFFQLITNLFLRLIISFKKKLKINNENNYFLNGDFFESLSYFKKKESSKIIYSTINEFPDKKNFEKYKKKIWIFHNSDEIFDIKTKKKLDFFQPKKCFSQNLTIQQKNYFYLPIGLENGKFHNHGNTEDFKKLRKMRFYKISRILYGFNITNPQRIKIKKNISKLKICDETKGWNSYFYRRILSKYMFVICPEGNGIDTHRLWEALYLKTIPIIKKNKISPFLQKANLPILILNDWSDLTKFYESKLKSFYAKKKRFFNNNFLNQKYWINIFRKL